MAGRPARRAPGPLRRRVPPLLLLAPLLLAGGAAEGRAGGAAGAGGGVDAHGRTAACRACQRMVSNLDENLLPALLDVKARQGHGRPGTQRYGQYEEVIEGWVERACKVTAVHLDPALRRACRGLVEDHHDALVGRYYAWARLEDGDEMNLNFEVCFRMTRACPEALARLDVPAMDALELGAGPDDETADGEQQISEPVAGPHRPGSVLKAVGANFVAEVAAAAEDVLVYYAFPSRAPAFHAAVAGAMAQVAAALARHPFKVAVLDKERNSVPAAYGRYVTRPALVFYDAQAKATPRFLRVFEAGRGALTAADAPRALEDVLGALHRVSRDPAVRATIAAALVQGGGGDTSELR